MSRINTSQAYKYISELYATEDKCLTSIQNSIQENQHKHKMQLNPVEGKLLGMLLRLAKCKKILEIGTLAGYSTAWIAKFLPRNGIIVTIEKSLENYQIAQNNLKKLPYPAKVQLLNGVALDLLPTLKDMAPFDAVFIDADKTSYPKYLEYAYSYLKKGGLIIADNTFLFNQVFNDHPDIDKKMWQSMRDFNNMLADHTRFEAIIIPTEEGLSLAIKK